MARAIWSGSITYGMLSIPVKLYPATENKDIAFHLMHDAECQSRINQKRWCPAHDREVNADELTRVYEYSKDTYIEITPDDVASLPVAAKNNIQLKVAIHSLMVDPTTVEKSYWLAPEKLGGKPYYLLLQALIARNLSLMATIAIRQKETMCAVRASADGNCLMLDTLFWPDEIRERTTIPPTPISDQEMSMAIDLIDSMRVDELDPDDFKDHYREAMTALIQAKVDGMPIKQAEVAPTPPQQDLMVMLRGAIAKAKEEQGEKPTPIEQPTPRQRKKA